MHFLSWFVKGSPQAFQEGPLYFFHTKLACLKPHVSLVLHQSYKRRHHCGGVTQSLDGRIRTLLKIMVVPRHVEGRESGATTLHGAGDRRGCQRHSQAAVWRQRSLDGMRNGSSYGCSAGTQGTQRLWMLKSRETGWGGYPGTEGQVIRCCKSWSCKQRERMPDVCTATHKAGKNTKRGEKVFHSKANFNDKLSLGRLIKYFFLYLPLGYPYLPVAVLITAS